MLEYQVIHWRNYRLAVVDSPQLRQQADDLRRRCRSECPDGDHEADLAAHAFDTLSNHQTWLLTIFGQEDKPVASLRSGILHPETGLLTSGYMKRSIEIDSIRHGVLSLEVDSFYINPEVSLPREAKQFLFAAVIQHMRNCGANLLFCVVDQTDAEIYQKDFGFMHVPRGNIGADQSNGLQTLVTDEMAFWLAASRVNSSLKKYVEGCRPGQWRVIWDRLQGQREPLLNTNADPNW